MSEGIPILRHVRITNSGKLSDRYVTVQVKPPADPTLHPEEQLFGLVEIENPWFPTSQIGQTIINTVAREYYRGDAREPLVNFERALKKLNETLTQLANTGEIDWVGKLHAALVLRHEEELHIAAVGGVAGWLVRAGKSTQTVVPQDSPSSSEHTFASVLSGTLEPGDRFLLASSGLTSVLSGAELTTNVLMARELGQAALHLANLLRAKRAQWVNALFLDAPSPATAGGGTLPETLYLDTSNLANWRLTAGTAAQRLHTSLLTIGGWLERLNDRLNQTMRQVVFPHAQRGWTVSRSWGTTQWQRIQEAKQRTQPAPSPQPPSDPDPQPVAPEQSIIGQTIFSINDYRHGQTAPSASQIREYRATQPGPSPAVRLPSLALPALPALGQQLGRSPLWQSRTLGMTLLAGALIVILLINLRALSSKRETEQQAAAHAAELVILEDQLEEAKLAKVFNQPDKARTSFQAVLTGASGLAGTTVAAEAALLASDAQAELDELTVTTRLANLTELATVQDGTAVSLWDGQLSVLGADGSLLTVPLTGGETGTVTASDSAPPVATTAFDEKVGLAVLTSTPSVLELTAASGPTAPLVLASGSWKAGTALAPFFNTLYVLAPADNQIWKFASTNGQFQAPVGYVEDGTDLSGAVDLAIDGSVYVLLGDGQIRKFSRGKVTEFPLRDIPEPAPTFTAPKQLLTTRDGEALYVLDANRVVVLDTTGRFKRQYAFAAELGEVTRIAITPDETTLAILTPTALYSTPL